MNREIIPIGSRRPIIKEQKVYSDQDWARMTAYLWNLDDEDYIKEFPFYRRINLTSKLEMPFQSYKSIETRLELRRTRNLCDSDYFKIIRNLLDKVNSVDNIKP